MDFSVGTTEGEPDHTASGARLRDAGFRGREWIRRRGPARFIPDSGEFKVCLILSHVDQFPFIDPFYAFSSRVGFFKDRPSYFLGPF